MSNTPQKPTSPYQELLQAIVNKIRSQPLLFILAMAVLIVSVIMVGGELGSADLRFIVIILAGLAVLGAVVYYGLEARKTTHSKPPPPTPRSSQTMTATGGSKIINSSQTADISQPVDQDMNASEQSTIKDDRQSTASSKQQ